VGKKPDEIIRRPDGSEEWITYGKYPRHAGTQTLMIKVKSPEGVTVEVVHIVRDRDGNEIHRHSKPIRRRS
jgi:hypothetical protein